MEQKTINQFQRERKGNESFVIVEGYHALKHAFRFGGEIQTVYLVDNYDSQNFGETVRDDVFENFLTKNATTLSADEFGLLTQGATRTGVIARVRRVETTAEEIFSSDHIVVLENPRDLNNLGAVVRVCAARGNTSLIVTGDASPWHAHAIRGGAGLQWALPIVSATVSDVFASVEQDVKNCKVYACTDEGDSMYEADLTGKKVLVFGTEREGITKVVRERADQKIAIPMQEGVSSLNLATSVSAVLYGGVR